MAALICLVSCGVTEPPVDQLVVTVSLSEHEIRPGESTEVTVRATNPTNTVLEFSSNSCVLVIEIVDATGREVYPGRVLCADVLLVHRLGPGEYLEEVFEFDGRGMKGWEDEFERYPLPAGTYWVRGAVTSRRENPSGRVALEIRPADG